MIPKLDSEADIRATGSGGTLGGRGSRSNSAAVRRAPPRPKREMPPATAPAPVPARSAPSLGMLAGFAAGGLIARSLFAGFGLDPGISLGFLDLLVGGSVVLLIVLRRVRSAHAQPHAPPSVSHSVDAPAEEDAGGGSSLDHGIRDIRRSDPGFDPTRFAGYTGMVFRAAQAAWTTQDIDAMRDRVTPEMYVELQAQCSQLRKIGQADRVERIEITAEITEAWQERGRDYATAYIDGSIVDYTVDEATQSLVHGSRTVPKDIEEFWTFTRPAGLNFWMLSAIRTA